MKHYTRHTRVMEKLATDAERERFEELAVERGVLLPKKPPGKPRKPDVFDEIASEVVRELRAEFGEKATNGAGQ